MSLGARSILERTRDVARAEHSGLLGQGYLRGSMVGTCPRVSSKQRYYGEWSGAAALPWGVSARGAALSLRGSR